MKFYHVSRDLSRNLETFMPRIPKDRLYQEDDSIPRICVSTSIQGCISAALWGGIALKESLQEVPCPNNFNLEEPFGVYLRVYEFEYVGNYYTDQALFESGLVHDAKMTHEHWLLEPCVPSKVYDILLYDWNEFIYDALTYDDEQRIGDGEEYDDVWDGDIWTEIYDISFIKLDTDRE